MGTYKAVIFGGSSGIGEATARLLGSWGWQVMIVGRNRQKLEAVRERMGGRVGMASVDALDPGAVKRFFEGQEPFDHLVLCHSGGKGAGPFCQLDLADLRSGLEAKLFAQLVVAQCSVGRLRPGGSITFVSAISARTCMPGTAGLAAINGALEAMVPVLALELAPLRVNAVSPGVIDTPWWNAMPREAKESFFQQAAAGLPVRRVGKPEDVAQAIGLLASNGYMTGTVLEVDGGARLVHG